MAQKRARRRFTREYKAQAVQRVIESGRPLADIAAELDVSPGQLSQWRNEQLAAGSAASRNGNIGPPARAKPREEILGRKYLQPSNCPATDDPGYSGAVAKLEFSPAPAGM